MQKNFVFMGKSLLLLIIVLFSQCLHSQDLPLGYIVYFQTDFNSKKIPEEILLSGNSKSKLEKGWFILSEKNDTAKQFVPNAVALVDDNIFGEYIATFQLKPELTNSDSASAIYLIFGLRDSLNYYYVTMNEYSTNFCSMYKGINKIQLVDSSMTLQNNVVKTFTVKRNILERKITIANNGNEVSFTDPNLVMGYFGFGVEKAVLAINKITIWAPTSIKVPAPLFDNQVLKN